MNALGCYTSIFPLGKSPKLDKNNKLNPLLIRVKAQSKLSDANNDDNNNIEIRVCTNRTCRRQGSMDILRTLSGISPPHVSVNPCGCLGSCGAGPNLVVLPRAVFVRHCSTPARAARTMFEQGVGRVSEGRVDSEEWIRNSLSALALRKRAEDELGKGAGHCHAAEQLLSEAINLKPCGGVHNLYKARCAARLVMGNIPEALNDAQEAISQAPKDPEAYICQADALMAIDQYDEAEKSYAMSAELNPSIFRSKSFKARIAKLQERLVAADLQ